MKHAVLVRSYDCEAMFEITVEYKGNSYLVIYGKHINGYFCCLPTMGFGCEMADPIDIRYNAEKLHIMCGFDDKRAYAIAEAIESYYITSKSKNTVLCTTISKE